MSKQNELVQFSRGASGGGSKNLLMNGAQVISQRGSSALTASASADAFITDRFRISNYSGATFTGQQVADAPTDFEYSCKVTTTGTDTSLSASQYQRFITAIEGYNMNHLNYGSSGAKTCTLSFHVKSSLTGAFYVFGFNAAANRSIVVGYTIDAANTWEKKTLTIAGDTSGSWNTTNGAGMYFGWSLGSGTNFHTTTTDAFQAGFKMAKSDQVNVAGTSSATWQMTGCQLEINDNATDFEHEFNVITQSKCERYYKKTGANDRIRLTQYHTSYKGGQMFFHPTMRAIPTLTKTDGGGTTISTGSLTADSLFLYVASGTTDTTVREITDIVLDAEL